MATWNVDTAHSGVGFSVKHMMFTTVRGSFDEFDATIEACAMLWKTQARIA